MFREILDPFVEPIKLLSKVYLDTETSGLNPGEHVILSMAFIHEAPTGEVNSLEVNVKPTELEWSRAHPKALEVNGMTWEFLEEHGIPINEAREELNAFVLRHKVRSGEAVLVGQNPQFDLKFLKKFFPDLAWLKFPYDDVVDNIAYAKTLTQYDLKFKPEGFNTHSLSRALGVVEEDEVHTALGGAEAVRRNYVALEQKTHDVFERMRLSAMKGDQHPDEFPEIQKVEQSHLDSFVGWAESKGWSRVPGARQGHVFVDPKGDRWLWAGYSPHFLIKLNL